MEVIQNFLAVTLEKLKKKKKKKKLKLILGFLDGSLGKVSHCNAGDARDTDLIPEKIP